MMNEWTILHPVVSYILFGLFSLAIGSLLNVIIYRLPRMMQAACTAECREHLHLLPEPTPSINLFFPRSHCTQCNTPLRPWHNIPLVSYLCLRGRCGTCRAPIGWQYPVVELMCLVLNTLAAYRFGFTPALPFVFVFICVIICLFFIDLRHQILPDSLTYLLLWAGLIANTLLLFTSVPNAVYSAAGAYLGLWLFVQIYYLITGKVGMGNGDFKLYAAFGAWFGSTQLIFIILASSLVGAIVGLVYLKTSHQAKDTPIPFGPFLCIAGLLSLFYGPAIFTWYLQLFNT